MKKTAMVDGCGFSLESVRERYLELIPQLERFTKKLEVLISDIVSAKEVSVHVLEGRTKGVASFCEKISRSSKLYSDPLREVTDLSGIRIITYYQDDADLIGKIIESEFVVDADNSVRHQSSGAEFGYRSAHYVICLSEARSVLPEWAAFSGFKAEIQVRTVLQHAWAAISHKLQYKREDDVPEVLRRKLFRLSALLEIADDEFISLRGDSKAVEEVISEKMRSGDLGVLIDMLSLRRFVESSVTVVEVDGAARDVGFKYDGPDLPGYSYLDGYSDLIQLLNIAGLSRVGEFERLLDGFVGCAEAYLGKQFEANRDGDENGVWYVSSPFVCGLILLCVKGDKFKLGHLLKLGWNSDLAKRVLKVAKEFRCQHVG